MKFFKILILLLTTLVLNNCSQRLTDFTIISSKNIDLSRAAEFKRGGGRVVGKDTRYTIIVIPTGMPDVKQAVDRAIEKTPGAVALLDGVLSYRWWFIPLIYGESWYEVEGTPLIDPKLKKSIE